MNHNDLGVMTQMDILTTIGVSVFMIIVALVFMILTTTTGKVRAIVAALILLVFDAAVFIGLNDACSAAAGKGGPKGYLGELLIHLPTWTRTVIMLGLLIFAWVKLIIMIKYISKHITPFSISEALDAMPQGIAYSTEDGQVLQINTTFEDLAFRTSGRVMNNARIFWDDLRDGNVLEGIVVEPGDDMVVTYPEGDTWIFSNSVIEEGVAPFEFRQLQVVDATKERILFNELDAEAHQLSKMNHRLRNYNNVVDQTIREEELLETKMRVHDNMGAALIAAKMFIMNDDSPVTASEVLFQWEGDMALIREEPLKEQQETSQIKRLEDAAKFLGIDLQLVGEMPSNFAVMNLICTGIQECMTNAIQHAEATQMYVVIGKEANEYQVSFSNNGKPVEGEIKEGSGMTILREHAEKMGATMEYKKGLRFNLVLHIPLPEKDV